VRKLAVEKCRNGSFASFFGRRSDVGSALNNDRTVLLPLWSLCAINDQTDERREGRQSSAADEANTSNDGSGVGAIRPWGLL
jgi:hypothetical protein